MANVLQRQSEVFKEELGPLLERELQRLVEDKIIEPMQFAEWAAPIVPVRKLMVLPQFVGIINSQ